MSKTPAEVEAVTNPRPIINSAVMVELHDMLIIGLANHPSHEEVERICKEMSDELPGIRVCVLDNVSALGVAKAAAAVVRRVPVHRHRPARTGRRDGSMTRWTGNATVRLVAHGKLIKSARRTR